MISQSFSMYRNRRSHLNAEENLSEEDIANIQYIRDFYIKDFNYLSPGTVGANKNSRATNCVKSFPENRGSWKLFAKLWLGEVLKGLKQFLYEGSLHGVKYIFEPTFSRKERLTWVVIVGISIAFCAVNIIQLFSKWTSTPFVNVIDSLPTPLWAIPFPSVVLCPHLHVKRSYANVARLTDLQRFYAGLVCPQMKSEKIRTDIRLSREEHEMLQDFLIKGSLSCKEVIRACSWRPRHGGDWATEDCCEKMFKPIFTNYGLCFTFNSLPLNGMTNETSAWQKSFHQYSFAQALEWDLDKGYPKTFPPDPDMVPWRVNSSGEEHGLELELFLNSSEHQFACDGNSVGFTVLITSPTNHVYTTTVIRLPMNRMTSIEVNPITYKTDSSLRTLAPEKRQCFFQNEKKLNYFTFYTGTNCKQDMYILEVKKACNCVFYNWPRSYIWEPVCSTHSDYNCVKKVRETLEMQFMYASNFDSDEDKKMEEKSYVGFSCYPPCNDINYASQIYYSNIVHRAENITTFDQPRKKEITQMNVHFYNDMFLGQHRHAQYDDYYFAGAIGGLLSLFLGFSIISVAELVYFVILKPVRTAFANVHN